MTYSFPLLCGQRVLYYIVQRLVLEISAEPHGRICTVSELASYLISVVENLPDANRIELRGRIPLKPLLLEIQRVIEDNEL